MSQAEDRRAQVALEVWRNRFDAMVQNARSTRDSGAAGAAKDQIKSLVDIVDSIKTQEDIFKRQPDQSPGHHGPLYRALAGMHNEEREAFVAKHQETILALETEVPPPTLEDQLEEVRAGNECMDRQLDDVAEGVLQLREIAIDMNKELDRQNKLIPDVQAKSDLVGMHMASTQGKIDEAIRRARSSRFLIYMCLSLVLILLWGVLFRMSLD